MEQLQDLIRKARALESAGQDAPALECYQRALAASTGTDTNLLARAGLLQLRLGQVDEAAETLARASDLYAEAGMHNNALALCQRVLRADASRTEHLRRVAELSAAQGYESDARRAYDDYATRLEGAGDDAGAAAALRAYRERFPDDDDARARLAALGGERAPARAATPEPTPPPPPPDAAFGGEELSLLGNEPAELDVPDGLLPTRSDPSATAGDDAAFAPLEGLETTHWGDEPAPPPPPPAPRPAPVEPADPDDALPLLGADPEPGDALPLLTDDAARREASPAAGTDHREQISAGVAAEDAASHYDLGVAFKEMELWDDAIGQLQLALQAGAPALPTLAVLGECYVEARDPESAIATLERAVRLPGTPPADLVGVHYWLGRAHETAGATAPAADSYARVLAVDPAFRDAAARLETLRDA